MALNVSELIRRAESAPPRFSGLLREWTDPGALAAISGRLLEQSAESGLAKAAGRYTASLGLGLGLEQTSLDARLLLATPGRYRIDFETDRAPKSQSIVCDGQRLWTVYADRVSGKDARPVPPGISQLADLSWLLDGYSLTSEGSATLAGRDAALLQAVPTSAYGTGEAAFSRQPIIGNKIELAVDTELGIALIQQWYFDDRPVLRTELTDVGTEVPDEAFAFEPAPGVRVLTDPGLFAEAGLSAGAATWYVTQGAAKFLLDAGRWLTRGGASRSGSSQ
jgi:outer membrane lipoprotein-sorting protein